MVCFSSTISMLSFTGPSPCAGMSSVTFPGAVARLQGSVEQSEPHPMTGNLPLRRSSPPRKVKRAVAVHGDARYLVWAPDPSFLVDPGSSRLFNRRRIAGLDMPRARATSLLFEGSRTAFRILRYALIRAGSQEPDGGTQICSPDLSGPAR